MEARREAEDKANWRFATDLLVWVFLPALLNVAEQAYTAGILSQWEAEGEAISGLWEMAIRKHQTSEGLSGRLVNAGGEFSCTSEVGARICEATIGKKRGVHSGGRLTTNGMHAEEFP